MIFTVQCASATLQPELCSQAAKNSQAAKFLQPGCKMLQKSQAAAGALQPGSVLQPGSAFAEARLQAPGGFCGLGRLAAWLGPGSAALAAWLGLQPGSACSLAWRAYMHACMHGCITSIGSSASNPILRGTYAKLPINLGNRPRVRQEHFPNFLGPKSDHNGFFYGR